jgi:hypothetical protein
MAACPLRDGLAGERVATVCERVRRGRVMSQSLTKAQVLALRSIQEQLRQATDAPKCYSCGYFHQTVNTLACTALG